MTADEAREVAREYDEARLAARAALARFDTARRAYYALPLFFDAPLEA